MVNLGRHAPEIRFVAGRRQKLHMLRRMALAVPFDGVSANLSALAHRVDVGRANERSIGKANLRGQIAHTLPHN